MAYTGVFFGAGCAILGLGYIFGGARFATERLEAVPRRWMFLFTAIYLGVLVLLFRRRAMSGGKRRRHAVPRCACRRCTFANIASRHYNQYVRLAFRRRRDVVFVCLLLRQTQRGRDGSIAVSTDRALGNALLRAEGSARRRRELSEDCCFSSAPPIGLYGSSAYADVSLAAVAFAVFYLLQIWRRATASLCSRRSEFWPVSRTPSSTRVSSHYRTLPVPSYFAATAASKPAWAPGAVVVLSALAGDGAVDGPELHRGSAILWRRSRTGLPQSLSVRLNRGGRTSATWDR